MNIHKANYSRHLFLTYAGVMIEVTICAWCIVSYREFWQIPLTLCGYHVGYITSQTQFIRRNKVVRNLLEIASPLVIVISLLTVNWLTLFLGLCGFSTTLQFTRRLLKQEIKVASLHKNLAKTAGMLLGSVPIVSFDLFIILLSATFAIVYILSRSFVSNEASVQLYNNNPIHSTSMLSSTLLWFEFFHHAHYFAYCYVFWLLLDSSTLPLIGPLFLTGWGGYFVLEWSFRESSQKSTWQSMIWGHTLCAVALVIMGLNNVDVVVILAWLITGIGGGTAYALDSLHQHGKREMYENCGHVFGCAFATVILVAFQDIRAVLVLSVSILAIGIIALLLARLLVAKVTLIKS